MPTLYDNFSQVRQYIDQEKPDLTSYVTKTELANCGYISSIPVKYPTLTGFTIPSGATEIKFRSGGLNIDNSTYDLYPTSITYSSAASQSNRTWVGMGTLKNYVDGRIAEIESSYATTSYVVDYVAEHGGGGSTVIDENIIPKENNTYTLGDSSHIYSTSYITEMWLGGTHKFSNRSNSQINLMLNNAWRYVFHVNNLSPANDNAINLGQSSTRWKSTYTANLYANTAYLQDTSYTKSIVPAEDATYTLGGVGAIYRYAYIQTIRGLGTGFNLMLGTDPKYDFYSSTFRPRTNGNINLGSDQYKWATTYTTNLYADNIHNLIWTGTSAEYAALSDYTTYQFYLIENE